MADTTTNTPTIRKGSTKEIGQTGTLVFQGIISGEEYNRALLGKQGLMQYDIMRRSDSTVHSALQVVKLPILATTWNVEPAADIEGNVSDQDKEIASFVKRELMERKINWHSFMREALNMLDFGFSVFEKVYELTEYNGQPRIGLAKLASRKQTTIYSWKISDNQPGITQQLRTVGGVVEIPREKLCVFTNEQEGDNYEGISLLRYAYKDWDIMDKMTLINAIALEKMAVGVPIVQPKDGETPSEADLLEAENVLSNMRANQQGYMRLPSTLEVNMLDLKANSTKDVIPSLGYHKRQIFNSILAGFMDLGGSSGSGAKALSGDLTSLFMKSEEAVANILQAAIYKDIVQQLCDFNYSSMPNGYPKLKYGTIADDDTIALSQSVNLLATAGMLTYDPELEDHIRGIFRFPELPEELKEDLPGSGTTNDIDDGDIANKNAKTKPASNMTKEDVKNLDKKTQAALNGARKARQKLIDTLVS